MDKWQPIETLPQCEHVLLYFPIGERGNGGIEAATVCIVDGEWAFWTHGGPNSGSDWDPNYGEKPSHWMPLPPKPLANPGNAS